MHYLHVYTSLGLNHLAVCWSVSWPTTSAYCTVVNLGGRAVKNSVDEHIPQCGDFAHIMGLRFSLTEELMPPALPQCSEVERSD